jgi:hypothetical protein
MGVMDTKSRCDMIAEAHAMFDLNNIPTVTKSQAATHQLCAAIRLFFEDGDSIAVHTLACAAREIYEKHCGKAGVERMLDHIKASNPKYTQKEIMDLINAARNFFKHEGASLDDRIEFSDEMNDFALFSACYDCTMLCTPNQPAEVQAYSIWFIAVKADPTQIERAREIAKEIDTVLPGLRNATRVEQKRAGRKLLDEAQRMISSASP